MNDDRADDTDGNGASAGAGASADADTDTGGPDQLPELSPVVDFGLTLKRAQHLLAQRLDEVLRPLDLNLGLWAVLRVTARQPGASASELARATFHTPQTLSGLLQRLQDRGLVERTVGRGRIVDNRVTPAGHATLATATRLAEAVMADSLTALPPTDQATLQRLLADYATALTTPRPHPSQPT